MMEILDKLSAGGALSRNEAAQAMEGIMGGSFTPAQSAAILIALRMRGETPDEIVAFAGVMRSRALAIHPKVANLLDTCGTGGDCLGTFNISTAAAIIASAAGASVAKHGNRSVSSRSGSADVIEALGARILRPAEAEACIEKTGFGFLFAPYFHPAMKNVAQVRRELGVRTIFNMLGPLSNPAGAQSQLLGAFDLQAAEKMAGALCLLGTEHALVVNSEGMDEIGLGETDVFEVKGGAVERLALHASEFGFAKRQIPAVQSCGESARVISGMFSGQEGAARDVALLNAAAALYACGRAASIESGLRLSEHAVDSGRARAKLEQVRQFCAQAGGNDGGHP
jgi:anthranilate phosphoribosyltransferase